MTADAPTDWGGTFRYRAARVRQPRTLEELREVVAAAPAIRARGTRHSFHDLADLPDGDIVSITGWEPRIDVDADAGTVTVTGGTRYGDLARRLEAAGWALSNLASLPHISVAGAIATGTHGSGDAIGSLATAVEALELVTADGEVLQASRASHPTDFDGMVVALGALGVVTRVTLRIEPSYRVAQAVWVGLPLDRLGERLDEITALATSTSCFVDWAGDRVSQLWLKTRLDRGALPTGRLWEAEPADGQRHPIAGADPASTTEQGGVPGAWLDRLPHFRLEHTPSAGLEIQSEFFVARSDAAAAIEALRAIAPRFASLVQVTEVRTIAADDLWLSGACGRPTLGLHFTWHPDRAGVEAVVPELEAALAPFGVRPHWGKVFAAGADVLAERYPRLADFRALAARLDPTGKFRNPFLDRAVFG